MMDYYDILGELNKLQSGGPKMAAIKKAIEIADIEKNYECSVRLRFKYIRETVFYDDIFKGFVMLPEYLKVFDEYYDKVQYESKDSDMLLAYTWVIDDSKYFYQISNEKTMEYLEDLKRRIIEKGYSLRMYYLTLSRCIEDIDENKFKKAFNNYLNAKKDKLDNCEKCEAFNTINFEMFHGSYEKAMQLAKPLLESKINCGNHLECLYNNIIVYHINNHSIKENEKELSKYKKLLYQQMSKSLSSLSFVDTIIDYCVVVNLDEGLRLFKKHLDWNLKIKTPSDKFDFELAAYKLFRAIKEKQNKSTIKLNLDENFELYKEDGVYSIDELIDYFKSDIIYIAKKFDEKNKNNDYMEKVTDDSFLL